MHPKKESEEIMEATMKTVQITLPVSDAAFLRRQSRNMGWHIVTIRSPRNAEPKVKMTEEGFRAKLAHSSAQAAQGKTIRMNENETSEQFINRLLCI